MIWSADKAACEGFFGQLKRERVNHRQYRTRDEARADLFDYLERFHNPRMRRRVARQGRRFSDLTQPSVLAVGADQESVALGFYPAPTDG